MSQYNVLDREREVVAALTGHDGATGALHLGASVISGTLDLSSLLAGLVKITDAATPPVTWTVSTSNVIAVGIG